MRVKQHKNIKEKLLAYIKQDNAGCWIWTGHKSWDGYGRFRFNYKRYFAHRASYTVFVGDIPKGMCVCHSCDNPSCCNPEHLWLGTKGDNNRDSAKKKRAHFCTSQFGEDNHNAALTKNDVKKILEMLVAGSSYKEIAVLFGVNPTTIGKIKRKEIWSHVDER